VSILSAIDDIQIILDDHFIKAQTMQGSPFIKPFKVEMDGWESKLASMQGILDNWLKVNKIIIKIILSLFQISDKRKYHNKCQ